MKNKAIIIVDMLNDFVTGSLKCIRANHIIKNIKKLIDYGHSKGIPIIYLNDAHIEDIDFELKLWGNHAIKGTKGAEVIPQLKPTKKDFIVEKRRYSGFFQTDLDILLKELKIDTIIITGLHANMCVRHTSADAFQLGYKIEIPKDCVECFTEEEYTEAISYLKKVYGAKITNINSIIKK